MKQIRILVVDDEADTASFIIQLLKRQNYRISSALTGEDALVLLEANSAVDLILLDVMMPGLDGFDVLDIIKNNPKTRDIPIIMLTAKNRVEDKVKAFAMGAADYLAKPFEKAELIARIETHLKIKRSTDSAAATAKKFHTIIDHANDAIMIFKDFRGVFVNRAIEKILGYSKEEFLELDFDQLFPPNLLPQIKERYQRHLSGEPVTSIYELDMLHKNGQHVPLEISVNLINYEGDTVPLVIARDIAERRSAEEKINALARFPTEAPHPILRISAAGQLMYSNLAGLNLVNPESLDDPAMSVPPAWQRLVQQALRGKNRFEVEHTYNHRDYSCTFVPFPQLGYVNVYGIDITERIEAEQALRKSEERYRMLAENVRDLIAKLALDGTYTYVSPASQSILGYAPTELMGQSFYSFIHPEDLAEILQMNPPLLDPGNELPFTLRFKCQDDSYIWLESSLRGIPGSTPADDTELVIAARDVTERKRYEAALQQAHDELEKRVEQRTAALTRSNILLQQVIEDRRQAEAQVIRFNQELLTLQYAGAAIASSLDLQFVLHTVTRELVDMLKVDGSAIVEWSKNHGTLVANYGPDGWWDNGPLAQPGIAKEVMSSREYRHISGEGLPGAVKTLLITPLVFQDHEVGYLEIADSSVDLTFTNQQISLVQLLASQAASAIENAQLYQQAQQELADRKKAEAALEEERAMLARRVTERTAELSMANAKLSRAARLKDEFLASMSHELRTPLNTVLSMSEALQEEVYGGLNKLQTTALKNIEASGRHLLALINDILDLSKIEAGKLDLQLDIIPIEQVCRASLLFVKQLAHQKRITVHAHISDEVVTLKADERRLKQILVNLLSNAVKFTPEGGQIGLDVTANPEQQRVALSVWDTGIGIGADKMEQLFEPFVQLDSKLSRRYSGTGLGLALVRRMVELHGGSISLESTEGHGSRFTVLLPWEGNYQTPTAPPLAENAGPVIRRALIIEDSPVVTDQYSRYLQEIHLSSTVCHTGANALRTAVDTQPDIIILDILLPDHTGWDVLADLKAHPNTRHIPVVVASVLDDEGQAQALGAVAHLTKPISRQQLLQTLKSICCQKEPAILPASQPDSDKKPLIVLAEDNEMNLHTVSDYLTRNGYRIVPARNGQEAINRAQEITPDLILMDIQMPDMDGLEAMQRLRAEHRFAAVPIIALTALAMPGDRERCLEAGANDYMSKPVSLKNLRQTIELLLKQTQAG
ncbi:MAG: Sensor histidine kinase RcsC [Anaerolineae bacterium]|nr:Sensor histidine kinase RcsC [Anaerolineae bacterium]